MSAKHRLPVCGLLMACTLVGCREPAADPTVRPVRAVKVGDVTGITGRSFPGQASATEEVNLSFRISGPLPAKVWINPPADRPEPRMLQLPHDTNFKQQLSHTG